MNAPARSSDRIRELERQLHWAQLKIQSLEERLRQRRIQLLGPKSETLSNLQLELLAEEEPGTTRDEVEAEARRETLTRTPPREAKPHPGRKPLPENLPRVDQVIRLRGAQLRSLRRGDGGDRLRRKRSSWTSNRRAISCA